MTVNNANMRQAINLKGKRRIPTAGMEGKDRNAVKPEIEESLELFYQSSINIPHLSLWPINEEK
jgi:hypothetical protein